MLNTHKITWLLIISQQTQITKHKTMVNSKKTQPAKVKLVRNYCIADIFFESNNN
jgi:hypothetical protein